MASFRRIGIFQPIVVDTIVIVVGSRPAVFAQSSPPTTYAGEFVSDFKYLVNNTADDAIDVVTAPLHIEQASGLVRSPEFYLVLGGVGAVWAARTRSIKRCAAIYVACHRVMLTFYRT